MDILYLGLEGVAFARRPTMYVPRCEREESCKQPLPLLEPLSELIATCPQLAVVINSWLVVDFGYRRVLQWLPDTIASRIIGATFQGNRVHRRDITYQSRLELLRADIRRRAPDVVTILDGSGASVPVEHDSRAIVVEDDNLQDALLKLARLASLLQQPAHVGW
jgi:hypothetical protein